MLPLILLIGISVSLFFEFKRIRSAWMLRKIPGPRNIPFIGSKYFFTPHRLSDLEIPKESSNGVGKLFCGPQAIIVVAEPSMMKAILSSNDCLEKPYYFDVLKISSGLIASKGNKI